MFYEFSQQNGSTHIALENIIDEWLGDCLCDWLIRAKCDVEKKQFFHRNGRICTILYVNSSQSGYERDRTLMINVLNTNMSNALCRYNIESISEAKRYAKQKYHRKRLLHDLKFEAHGVCDNYSANVIRVVDKQIADDEQTRFSSQTRVDFMQIPKTGSTSFRDDLPTFYIATNSEKESSWSKNDYIRESAYVFTVLRSPKHHLVSMWKHCKEALHSIFHYMIMDNNAGSESNIKSFTNLQKVVFEAAIVQIQQ